MGSKIKMALRYLSATKTLKKKNIFMVMKSSLRLPSKFSQENAVG